MISCLQILDTHVYTAARKRRRATWINDMMGDKKADFWALEKIGGCCRISSGEFHLLQKFADKSRDSVRQAVC